jgi:aspartyl-tRNA synthetase
VIFGPTAAKAGDVRACAGAGKLGRYDGRLGRTSSSTFRSSRKATTASSPTCTCRSSRRSRGDPKLDSDPKSVIATHYDLVVNGVELGSGSLRNHRSDLQLKILAIMGYSEKEARERFGFMLDALDTGAPPHGGFAFGFDRLALMLAGGESLRDVIAFPKTQRARTAS